MDNTGGMSPSYSAIEQLREGKTSTYNITNPATVRYLQRLAAAAQRDGYPVMVDVGTLPERRYSFSGRRKRSVGQRANIWKDQPADLGWVSHLLYLAAPILTIAAFLFMIMLQECKSKRDPMHIFASQQAIVVHGKQLTQSSTTKQGGELAFSWR